jgi:hypothetical protein
MKRGMDVLEDAIKRHMDCGRPVKIMASKSAPRWMRAKTKKYEQICFTSKFGFVVPIVKTKKHLTCMLWDSGHLTVFTTI